MKNSFLKSFAVTTILMVAVGMAYAEDLAIESFAVSSGQTASPADHPFFTTDASTTITFDVIGGEGTTYYHINDTGIPPGAGDWQESHELNLWPVVGVGKTSFYAWVKDDERMVGPAEDWIAHSIVPPYINVVAAAATSPYAIDFVDAASWVIYGIKGSGEYQTLYSDLYQSFHTFTLENLLDGTTYDVTIHSDTASQSLEITTPAAPATTDNVTWSGGAAPEQSWTRGVNWAGLQPPANPTPGTVTLGTAGTDAGGKVLANAIASSTFFEPFDLVGGEQLDILVDGSVTPVTVTFADTDFAIPGDATAQEIVDAINTVSPAGCVVSAVSGGVVFRTVSDEGGSLAFTGSAVAILGLPTELVQSAWQIGSLSVGNNEGTHTVDLSQNILKVNGNVTVNSTSGGDTPHAKATFTNGTLQIGTSAGAQNITIGTGWGAYRTGTLAFGAGTTFDANIATLTIGEGDGGRGYLDLRGANIAGGVLKADTIKFGTGGNGARSNRSMHIYLDDTTTISEIQTRYLYMAMYQCANVRIGNPNDGDMLPPNVSVTIGSQEARGGLRMGRNAWVTVDTRLVAKSGGIFTAWLTEMNIGGTEWGGTSIAVLDIDAMDSVMIDCNGSFLMPYGTNSANNLDAQCMLPRGTVTTQTMKIGVPNNSGNGARLWLNGTVFTVLDTATIGVKGKVYSNVAGFSGGLDIAEGDKLSVADGGLISVMFDTEQDASESGFYWGLRWKGKRDADLRMLKDAGKIDWQVSQALADLGYSAGVLYDANSGYTYVTALVEWPPTVTTSDLTLEILPPDYTTLVVSIDDIDVIAKDPAEDTTIAEADFISRWLTCDSGVVAADGLSVTFENVAADDVFTITVWHEVEFGTGTLDISGESTITAVLPGTTTEAVVWNGGASTTLMDRPEWLWGANWNGGLAPTVDSIAAFTFGEAGVALANKIEGIRQTGALSITNDTGTHEFDLGGTTLTVTGNLTVNSATAGGNWARATVSNGKLQVGQDGAPVNATIGSYWQTSISNSYKGGVLTVAPGAEFEAYIGTLKIGAGANGRGTLDLRGATIANLDIDNKRVLKATTIETGQSGWGNTADRRNRILLDNDTLLDRIEVRYLDLALGQGNRFRIGNPTNGQDSQHLLPDNLDIAAGTAGARGRIRMATEAWATVDSRIEANTGGAFTAYLDYMTIGGSSFGGTSTAILDIAKMDSVMIDCTGALTMSGTDTRSNYYGTVKFPAGSISFGTVTMGAAKSGSYSRLVLDGTVMTVATGLTINNQGTLTANIGSTSSGINLSGSLTVADGGAIQINFLETSAGTGRHEGLRWNGTEQDTKDVLDALELTGKLQVAIDDAVIAADPNAAYEIGYDTTGGYAYVALISYVPDLSTYAFSFNVDTQALAGEDTNMEVTLATDVLNDVGYDLVGVSYETTGPGNVTITKVDTELWPGEGFVLPADYSQAVNYTLHFSNCGEYTITFSCYEIGDEENPFAQDSVVVNVSLYGDANGDYTIDLLDLVFVRNRLFSEDPGDAAADVNGDGSIGLDDLIEVRNKLGSTCQ